MNIHKKREAFEAKFKYQSDLDKVVFCEAENKYKALPELKSYELVHQIVGRVNDQWELWQAAKAQAVPEGFVLVPKEPTEAMYIAGADKRQSGGNTADVYKAMIEAQEQSHD